MTAADIEITAGDMGQIGLLFDALAAMSDRADGRCEMLAIHARLDGQEYVIGYGEAGEPAILSVKGPES